MLRLLRQISLPQLRSSWGRTCLVIGGIATGVTLIVAIDIINTSVLENFRTTLRELAGPADLQVVLGSGEVAFDESTVETVRQDPGIVVAVPFVRGVISLADSPAETLQLFGVDLLAEQDLERYSITASDRADALESIADPRSILVTQSLAARLRLSVGDSIRLSVPTGTYPFTVRGLLTTKGAATVFGGQLAVMDLPAAQLALGKEGRIDQIDLVLRDGVGTAAVRKRLERLLPESLSITPPVLRAAQYEKILSSFQAMVTGLSLLCLVAGLYIVYNTTSTGAIHRALALAELRMIGAEAAQIFRLLMFEALVLGSFGAALGLAAGTLLARLLMGMVSESMGIIFQLRFPVGGLAIDGGEQVVIASVGIATALFSSYFAARRVSMMEPLAVLRSGAQQVVDRTPNSRLLLSWVVLVVITVASLFLEVRLQSSAWGNFASTLWFASSVVIAIPFVRASAKIVLKLLPRLSRATGRVAAESLFRSPVRTGVTVAAVALVLTVAITVASLLESLRFSTSKYYQEGGFLRGDVVVSAIATQGGWLEVPLVEQVADKVAALPGVASVETVRAIPGHIFRGERVTLLALSDGLVAPSHYGKRWYHDGDPARAAPLIQAGRGANISVAMAERFDLHLGDEIQLESPSGPIRLPVVGIVHDYMADRGTITISRRLLAQSWGEHLINRISVFLADGVSAEAARQSIVTALGDSYRLKILLPEEMVRYHVDLVNRAFAFTDAIQLLVIIVTVAGIFDLLLAAIWERRRELTLWRLVGADERTVRLSVVIESVTIGCLGIVLGTVVGLITAWMWIGINFRYLVGFHLDYRFAFAANARYGVLVIAMTIVAGYCASIYATRVSIHEGLRME